MVNKIWGTFRTINPSESVVDLFGVEFIVKGQFNGEQAIPAHVHYAQGALPSIWGFDNENDRDVFRLLLDVDKVGPTTAFSIVNTFGADATSSIIREKDSKSLETVKGVGKKLADSICLMLEDKFKGDAFPQIGDAKKALLKLGYKRSQFIGIVFNGETAEELVQSALSQLSKNG
jgi:Holliday junction DNA helicase RuvA